MAAQRVLEIVDVALAGSEHENVARTRSCVEWITNSAQARATAVGMSTFVSRESRPSLPSGAADSAS